MKMNEHLIAAKSKVTEWDAVKVEENKVTFTVQDGAISAAGLNGVQASDMLHFMRELFASLDSVHPCEENKHTISLIDEACAWQSKRTIDRQTRGVEGKDAD